MNYKNGNMRFWQIRKNAYIRIVVSIILSCISLACSRKTEEKKVEKWITEQVVDGHLIYGYGFQYLLYEIDFRKSKIIELPYLAQEKEPEKRYFFIRGEQNKEKVIEYINKGDKKKINIIDFESGKVEYSTYLSIGENISYISFFGDNGKLYCKYQYRGSWKQIYIKEIWTGELFTVNSDISLLGITNDVRVIFRRNENSIEIIENNNIIEKLDEIEMPVFSENNQNIIYTKNDGIKKVIALYDMVRKKEFITNISPVDDYFYNGKASYFALRYPFLIYAEVSPKNKKPNIIRSLFFGMLESEPSKDYFLYDYLSGEKIGTMFTNEKVHFISYF